MMFSILCILITSCCCCCCWISSITFVNSFAGHQISNINIEHKIISSTTGTTTTSRTRTVYNNNFLLLMKSANIDDNDNDNDSSANDDKSSNNNNMGNSNDSRHFVLDNEEPLSVIFQRAVVLQRSGDHESALKEYQFFIKAAEGCDVSPSMYAEVHVNIGAVYAKDNSNLELAKHHFELAIEYRPDNMGTAYVNLALLSLRKGSSIGADNPKIGIQCLEEAESYLNSAINLKDDSNNNNNNNESESSDEDDDELQQPSTKTTALRLLEDVHAIMGQMKIR